MNKYENIIIITGLARSGTTAVHSKLDDHPDIKTFGEIFHYTAPDENYYKSYLQTNNIGAADILAVNSHIDIFCGYLDWLLERAGADRIVIDVKYPYFNCMNSITHGLLRPPHLITFIKENRMPVLHVKRLNLLRVFLSTEIATRYNVWNVKTDEKYKKPGRVEVNTEILIKSLRNRQSEVSAVEDYFQNYDGLKDLVYEEMFDEENPGCFHKGFVSGLFDFLKMEQIVDLESGLRKINKGTVSDLVENYDEVVKALTGTEFEFMLNDG